VELIPRFFLEVLGKSSEPPPETRELDNPHRPMRRFKSFRNDWLSA
jgi:hypothetical protein